MLFIVVYKNILISNNIKSSDSSLTVLSASLVTTIIYYTVQVKNNLNCVYSGWLAISTLYTYNFQITAIDSRCMYW